MNNPIAIVLTAMLGAVGCIAVAGESDVLSPQHGQFFKTRMSSVIEVADCRNDSALCKMVATAMQGVINQDSAQVYLFLGDHHKAQLDDTDREYTVMPAAKKSQGASGFRSIVDNYGNRFRHIYIWDPAEDWSWNMALMLSSRNKGMPLTPELAEEVMTTTAWNGSVSDLRHRFPGKMEFYDWAIENMLPQCHDNVMFSVGLREDWRVAPWTLYDYVTASGGFAFWLDDRDVTVAVLGINKSIEREGQDRYTITLPPDQEAFIKEAFKVNPRTIVVLVAGSSLAINWIDENVPAILNAWYPGEQGGVAVAEAIFGDYNPGGRLPITYYTSLDNLPPFDDYDIGKGRTYMYYSEKPLYAFGHGLSYTTFAYDNMSAKAGRDAVDISFEIRNTGDYDGDEVAQVYVSFPDCGMTTPIRQLKGFKRVSIDKGGKKRVHISVPRSELRLWDEKKNEFFTPAGEYLFAVGSASDKLHLYKMVKIN